jgi:transcriptional regulator CtsR
MTPDEILTHLEAELARCRDERDRLIAELEAVIAERDSSLLENVRLDRMLLSAERERDWLRGELLSVIGSKSWLLTRPLRRVLGSDRPEAVEPP